jgi:hypothetical protein
LGMSNVQMGVVSSLTSSLKMIVRGEDLFSVTLLVSSKTLALLVLTASMSARMKRCKIYGYEEIIEEIRVDLLIGTSESSIIEQFSLEFILRRLEGDALSTRMEAELMRLAVRVTTGEGISACCCCSDATPRQIDYMLNSRPSRPARNDF